MELLRRSVGGVGQGVRTPLKNHKSIGIISNTGQDPLKNHNENDNKLKLITVLLLYTLLSFKNTI